MERSGTFRQQAISTANLLLEAADRLETSSSDDRPRSNLTSLPAGSSRAPTNRIVTATQQAGANSTGGVMPCGGAAGVRDRELRSLFNWTSRSTTGTGKRRKTGSAAVGKSKKKKIPTWSHTYVCLAQPDDDTVPDSRDRATLKLAGLGEKRFPIDVYSTGQEFYDELLFQYPKLKEGGGFELLRVPEGGGKDLEVIKVPDGGYNVEFLRAVVHSARIFIRPLQKSLDLRPQTSQVSKNCTIKVN